MFGKSTITRRANHRPKAKLTNIMNRERILGIIRHVLTTFGGSLVTKGTIDAGQLELAAGAVITLAGILWSVLSPEKKA